MKFDPKRLKSDQIDPNLTPKRPKTAKFDPKRPKTPQNTPNLTPQKVTFPYISIRKTVDFAL